MRQILRSWLDPIAPGQTYHFFVSARQVDPPTWHTFALLEWLAKPGGEPLKRVLLDLKPHTSTWQGTHQAPAGATQSRVSLCHYAHLSQPPALDDALIRFGCREETVPQPRIARLGVAFQAMAQPPSFGGNLQVLVDTVRQAGKQKIDLLCMSENLLDRGIGGSIEERACSLDLSHDTRLGPLWDAIRDSGVWCVFSLLHKIEAELAGPRFFITAVLASPAGIEGTYSKRQLTMDELERGISPGHELPVFETPWGRVGILICWDAWFPESATMLAQRRAEIICLPLAGDGVAAHWEHVWRARALDNQVFWMASVTENCSGGAPSRIIAPSGEVLAQTREPNAIAAVEVDVSHRETAHWLSLGACQSEVRNVYEHARREV